MTRLSDLTAVGGVDANDLLYVVADDESAQMNALGMGICIYKPSDQTVSASTTLQNDNDFVVTVEALGRYVLTYHLVFSDAGADGYKCALNGTSTATAMFLTVPNLFFASGGVADAYGAAVTFAASVSLYGGLWQASVEVATAGTLVLQWAQKTAASTLTLKAGSWMSVQRVG
jgi:hypothetical protein